jgi:hypothetical protein
MSKAQANRKSVLSGAAANQFKQPLAKFKAAMEARRELWQRLTPEQRERVLAADPVLTLAKSLHADLGGWFDA